MKTPDIQFTCDLCSRTAHALPPATPDGWISSGHLDCCRECAGSAAWKLFQRLRSLTRREEPHTATWAQVGALIDAVVTGETPTEEDNA